MKLKHTALRKLILSFDFHALLDATLLFIRAWEWPSGTHHYVVSDQRVCTDVYHKTE